MRLSPALFLASMGGNMPNEPDEVEEPPPIEPSGKELTAQRKRQADNRIWAEKLWNEILQRLNTK